MSNKKVWLLPLLLFIAVLIILAMLRLAVWQLDRADQKQSILDRRITLSQQAPLDLAELDKDLDRNLDIELGESKQSQQFLPVVARGRYLQSKTLYLDNQVFRQKVGYQVFTPMVLEQTGGIVLVARGWVSAGASRDVLPEVSTPKGLQILEGRLNLPAAPPPLWNDSYSVSKGAVWQYIDMDELAAQFEGDLHSLVLELRPDFEGDTELLRDWNQINDHWVAKHKAYAFQWFSMAFVFFIACVILLLRRPKRIKQYESN